MKPRTGARESIGVGVDFTDDPGKTQRHFQEETDINFIVERWTRGVVPSMVPTAKLVYGDFTNVGDYQEALDKVMASQNAFADLPSAMRTRFVNDPGALADYLGDDANHEEARELGLLDPLPMKVPTEADPASVKPAATEVVLEVP